MDPIVDGLVTGLLDGEDLSLFEGEGLHAESNTIRFERDNPVMYMAKLSGNTEIEARTTLRSANLTRLVKAENAYRDPTRVGTYTQVSGDFRNVHLHTEVLLGEEWVTITEFLRQIYIALTGKTIPTEEDFRAQIRNLGYRFDGDATMLWQHFGASTESWKALDDLMQSHGAFDDTGRFTNLSRITNITKFAANAPGFEVAAIDVTSADRNQSQTNQGFTNFVDAAVESLKRTLRYRKLSKDQKAKAIGDEAMMYNMRAQHLNQQATSWASNIAGIQERMTIDASGSVVRLGAEGAPTDHHVDPAKAQIGRMTLVIDGENTEIDLWTRPEQRPEPKAQVADKVAKVIESDDDDTEDTSEF